MYADYKTEIIFAVVEQTLIPVQHKLTPTLSN